jgi:hypothetical protein
MNPAKETWRRPAALGAPSRETWLAACCEGRQLLLLAETAHRGGGQVHRMDARRALATGLPRNCPLSG